LPRGEDELETRMMWFCIRVAMIFVCMLPGDLDSFFYWKHKDWWYARATIEAFLVPPCIPLPTMIDIIGGDRIKETEGGRRTWKRRVPSWRQSSRIWKEWFRLVAGCPAPAEDAESWEMFRVDAMKWWASRAEPESETQHRTGEFTRWLVARS
jgi:hypothetical protein